MYAHEREGITVKRSKDAQSDLTIWNVYKDEEYIGYACGGRGFWHAVSALDLDRAYIVPNKREALHSVVIEWEETPR
jgi:hypothetical protein